jgi:Xaa-Pro aminopeptidase
MRKRAALRRVLRNARIGGLLVTDLTNLHYLSGFTGSSGFLVITRNETVFVTDFRYEEQAHSEVKDCVIRMERSDRAGEVRKITDEFGIASLGFEAHVISYSFYRRLVKKGLKLKALSNQPVESLRSVKSEDEINHIKKAVRRAERAFRKFRPSVRAGSTELKLALRLEELLRKEGCKKLPFEVIVTSGSRSARPHAQPTGRTIKKGDLIVIDWGGEYRGYYSDLTRTLFVKGGDSGRKRELYHRVLEAQERAIRSVRAGVRGSVVDSAAREFITESGYGDNFGHGTGHGIGMAVHEAPGISWRSKDLIRKGMVFTIEPGIYLQGFGGVRIEDMVVAERYGPELLTSLSRRFTSV